MANQLKQYNTDNLSNDNELSQQMRESEHQIAVISKDSFNYKQLYEDMNLFLKKMPKSNVTEYVGRLLNLEGVFVTLQTSKPSLPVYSRVLVTKDNKIAGVSLSSYKLNIEPRTAESDSIDDCIYATYFGLIRGSLLCNDNHVQTNYDLHKLCITYLCNFVMKTIGKSQTFNKFKFHGIYITCSYLYFRHYLSFNHSSAISRTNRLFADVIDKETIKAYQPSLELISRYKSFKEIGKVLIDLSIISTNPNQLLLSLIQTLGRTFFYNVMSSIDFLIATIILTTYPTGIFKEASIINNNLQKSIEKLVIQNYLDRTKYSILPI